MVETAAQIEGFIEQRRERLGSNLDELEGKLMTATDWRGRFERRPMAWLGAVLAGGVVVGLAATGRRRRASRELITDLPSRASSVVFDGVSDEVSDVWRAVKSALLGVAASKVTEVIGEAVPGFREEFARTGRGRSASRAASAAAAGAAG